MNSNYNLLKINNYNYSQVPVKVIYFTKKKIISEKQFYLTTTFKTILSYFNTNLKEEGKTRLKENYIYNDKIINKNEPLMNLIELKRISSSTIESVEISIEIEENEIIEDDYIPYFNKIIQPKYNPFGLFVYKIKEGLIDLQIYPQKISKKYEMYKYNELSSYCNSPESLFISGGKLNDLAIKDFWIINNHKYSIIKRIMLVEKSNHSMIYVNINNNEYIFIVGGENNLNTFYYDIKHGIFENWADINSIHIKPALFQYKHYLYCFNSFNEDNYYFERTNLISKEHIWEKVFPIFDNDTISFKTESFGVSSCINGNILLIGGINIKPKTLIYDPEKNFLSLSQNGKNEKIILSDKYFYKVSDSHNVALPLTFQNKKEIAIVNKKKQSVRLIDFNISDGISKVKFKEEDYGKIIVKAKIHERLRFEIQSKIVSGENITITKNGKKFREQEIINVELKPYINENKIYTGKIKILKRKKNIYLPSSRFYNNILELIVSKNQENNNNLKIKDSSNDVNNIMNFNSNMNEKEDDLKVKTDENKNISKVINNNFLISKNIEINLNKNDNNINNNKNEEEERYIRDVFKTTITEPLESDIIMIEEYNNNYYDINNFADYEIPV